MFLNWKAICYVLDCKTKSYVIIIWKSACEIYDPSKGAIVVQMISNRIF